MGRVLLFWRFQSEPACAFLFVLPAGSCVGGELSMMTPSFLFFTKVPGANSHTGNDPWHMMDSPAWSGQSTLHCLNSPHPRRFSPLSVVSGPASKGLWRNSPVNIAHWHPQPPPPPFTMHVDCGCPPLRQHGRATGGHPRCRLQPRVVGHRAPPAGASASQTNLILLDSSLTTRTGLPPTSAPPCPHAHDLCARRGRLCE